MKLIPVSTANKPDLEFVERLYIESFPINERRPIPEMHSLIECKDKFAVLIVLNEDKERVGFLTYWNLEGFVYAEHFAISPEFRNGGNGAKVMQTFVDYFASPIILEVEEPTTEMAQRRIGFYKRLGFKLWDIVYMQPPYEKQFSPVPMKLMSYRNIDLNLEFENIKKQLYTNVYKVDDKE